MIVLMLDCFSKFVGMFVKFGLGLLLLVVPRQSFGAHVLTTI